MNSTFEEAPPASWPQWRLQTFAEMSGDYPGTSCGVCIVQGWPLFFLSVERGLRDPRGAQHGD